MATKYNIGAKYKDGKKTKCKWKGCQPDTHDTRLRYPNEGVVKRASYKGVWDKHNGGAFARKFGGRFTRLTANPNIKITFANFWYQKHHVIPVSVMKGLTNIPYNLQLLNWNMNDYDSNGICLPFNFECIKFYDLPAHRGSHPAYNEKVEDSLNGLESKCEKFCKINQQDKLLAETAKKVTLFKRKIVLWIWDLHAESRNHR